MGVFYIPKVGSSARRIAVLNVKGGCGKSMIATNLASYYARTGFSTALMDFDPQGSAIRWLSLRDPDRAPVHGIDGSRRSSGVTRSWHMRMPPGTERVVIDSPAGVRGCELGELVRQTDLIVIPVLPSDADIHSTTGFIAELLLDARVRASGTRVAVVANRVRQNTRIFRSLQRFLNRLEFPFVAAFRDSQKYVRAAEQGMGIHEMQVQSRVRKELAQWANLVAWIENGMLHDDVVHAVAARHR